MTNISALKYLPIDHDAVGKKNIYLYEICEPWLDGDVYIALCLGRVTPNEREKKKRFVFGSIVGRSQRAQKKRENTIRDDKKKEEKTSHVISNESWRHQQQTRSVRVRMYA